jgi:hypothetical protein
MKKTYVIPAMFLFLAFSCKKTETVPAGTNQNTSGPSGTSGDTTGYTPTIPGTGCNVWICMPTNLPFNAVWTHPPHGPYAAGAAVAAGHKVFFGGGREEGQYFGPIGQVYVYDASLQAWTKELILSEGRSHLSAIQAGQQVLFAGGKFENIYNKGNPDFFSVVDLFDLTTYQRTTAHLSEPRAHMASASDGNLAFFAGGLTYNGNVSENLDIYNAATDKWTVVKMPQKRAYAGAVCYAGNLYVAGGRSAEEQDAVVPAIDVYEIATGQWSQINLPHPHPVATVNLLNEKIFIAGGDGKTNNRVDIFNLRNSQWTSEDLSDSRFNIASATARNHIIYLGGNYSSKLDIYNDETGQWYRGSINTGVDEMSYASLPDQGLFGGFLFDHGNALPNTVWIIKP